MDTLYQDQITVEPCPLTPRGYQLEAKASVYENWAAGYRATLCVMATGTGKTSVGSLIAREFPDHRGRVLVLANRDELIRQWADTLRFVCNNDQVEVEHGDKRASRNKHAMRKKYGKKRAYARIVVASKDTMWREHRLKSFEKDEFGLIIVDEASGWSDENPSWHNIMSYFSEASVVGFDATPVRSDGKKMGDVFDSVACEYHLLEAVNHGWLVAPVQQYIVVDGFDLDSLKTKKGQDWSEVQLSRMIGQEKTLQGIAQQTVDYAVFEGAKKRPGHILSTLVFNASVDLARTMADILNRRHARDGTGKAAVISSRDTDLHERRKILDDFEEGRIKYLCNWGICTRGYDNPNIEMLVLGRPTKFHGLAVQMIGRSSRPLNSITGQLNAAANAEQRRAIIAASRKPTALILDPVGTTGIHSLSVDMADILGNEFGGAVVRYVKNSAMRGDGRVTAEDIQKAAEKRPALEAEELERRKQFIMDSTHVAKEVDPFAPSEVPVKQKRDMSKEKPTAAQVAILLRGGIEQQEIDTLNFGGAGKLVADVKRRWKYGLCSIKQSRLLISKGVQPHNANSMRRPEASALISSIIANGWRLPDSCEL